MDVLYLDNHLLVVAKPTGVLVQEDSTGGHDLLNEAKLYLKTRFNRPGNVFVGMVHRLDRPVSGVVVFARTSKAAGRLSQQFRERSVHKRYLAIVEGRVATPMSLRHFLRKDGPKARVVKERSPGAREAVMSCRPVKVVGSWTLLEIDLETGRPHQIRAQLAAAGHPVRGDLRYGAKPWAHEGQIALHAWRIRLRHPISKEPTEWSASPPRHWPPEAREYASSAE